MKKQKINVRILVQDNGESAYLFSRRIERFINEDIKNKNEVVFPFPISFTTANDGRQTANIQYLETIL